MYVFIILHSSSASAVYCYVAQVGDVQPSRNWIDAEEISRYAGYCTFVRLYTIVCRKQSPCIKAMAAET